METQDAVPLIIILIILVVSCFMSYFKPRPIKFIVGTILDAQVDLSAAFGNKTLFTIKNANDSITYAYGQGSHYASKGKRIEYQLSKLRWLTSKAYCYTEESRDNAGNKLIHTKTLRFYAIANGCIK